MIAYYLIMLLITSMAFAVFYLLLKQTRVKRSVPEVWYVNQSLFYCEQEAKGYATHIISQGYTANVTIPGCEAMDARVVWDVELINQNHDNPKTNRAGRV